MHNIPFEEEIVTQHSLKTVNIPRTEVSMKAFTITISVSTIIADNE